METKTFEINEEFASVMKSYLNERPNTHPNRLVPTEPQHILSKANTIVTGRNYHVLDASLRVVSYFNRSERDPYKLRLTLIAQSSRQIRTAKSLLEREVGFKLK
jgi:hypothetical protein